jgi:glycosyltransferase involved in cell wall biosynthesis
MIIDSKDSSVNGPQAVADGPLRILIVVDSFYPGDGGAEKQAQLLSRAFRDAGHAVKVVAPRLEREMKSREVVDGVPVERIVYPRIRFLGALILSARFAFKLLWERRHYDAIHVHIAKNLAAVAGLLRPVLPATLTVKISGAWEFDGGILDPELRRRPTIWARNRCIQLADTIQCISRFTYEKLVVAGYPQERLLMIPNAVDLVRFDKSSQQKNDDVNVSDVAYVGRLRAVKGIQVLVEAWSLMAPDHKLAIAGDGSLREELTNRIAELGLEQQVRVCGEIDNVPELLRQTRVYVQPSYQEGMPNSVLEAMAAGLPIVATRVSGNVDLVHDGENGFLVPPGDKDALAQAIRRLLEDPELASRMGERSRQLAAEFGVPIVTAKLLQRFRGTLAA